MKLSSIFAIAAIGLALGAGCSDLASTCAKATVSPDGTCSNDNLQCPYTFDQPSCDGTSPPTSVSSSCVCTGGAWSCPSAVACPDDAGATE